VAQSGVTGSSAWGSTLLIDTTKEACKSSMKGRPMNGELRAQWGASVPEKNGELVDETNSP